MPEESLKFAKTIIDLLTMQQNENTQTNNCMFEYYKYGNKFRFFEDIDFRLYSHSLLLGPEDVDLEELDHSFKLFSCNE